MEGRGGVGGFRREVGLRGGGIRAAGGGGRVKTWGNKEKKKKKAKSATHEAAGAGGRGRGRRREPPARGGGTPAEDTEPGGGGGGCRLGGDVRGKMRAACAGKFGRRWGELAGAPEVKDALRELLIILALAEIFRSGFCCFPEGCSLRRGAGGRRGESPPPPPETLCRNISAGEMGRDGNPSKYTSPICFLLSISMLATYWNILI